MSRDPNLDRRNFPIEKKELAPTNARLVTIQVFVREPYRVTLDQLAKVRGISRQTLAGMFLEAALERAAAEAQEEIWDE